MTRRAQRTQAQRAVDEDIGGQQIITAVDDAVRARHAAKARKTEREILKGIEAAKSMGKDIAFPDVRVLRSLFPTMSDVVNLDPGKFRPKDQWGTDKALRLLPRGASDHRGHAAISSYVRVDGVPELARAHMGLTVTVPEFLAKWVMENMMFMDGYRISFGVTVRDNGTALVTANYNVITGSRWIAIVHASYVPGLEGFR